jgi:hypothetical protein
MDVVCLLPVLTVVALATKMVLPVVPGGKR